MKKEKTLKSLQAKVYVLEAKVKQMRAEMEVQNRNILSRDKQIEELEGHIIDESIDRLSRLWLSIIERGGIQPHPETLDSITRAIEEFASKQEGR